MHTATQPAPSRAPCPSSPRARDQHARALHYTNLQAGDRCCILPPSMPASVARKKPPLVALLLLQLLLHLPLCAVDAFLYPRTSTTPRIATALSMSSSSSSLSASASPSAAAAGADGHVIAKLHPNRVLELQLNRPRQLNALSIEVRTHACWIDSVERRE